MRSLKHLLYYTVIRVWMSGLERGTTAPFVTRRLLVPAPGIRASSDLPPDASGRIRILTLAGARFPSTLRGLYGRLS